MSAWLRFTHAGAALWGRREGAEVALYDRAPWLGGRGTGERVAVEGLALLAPVTPARFIGLWNNFHAAAAKAGAAIPEFPLYFLKSPGSVLAPGGVIRPPVDHDGRVIYEGELGVVIGARCHRVSEAEAEAAIFGYTCVNDVTALGLFGTDPAFAQWARAKGCDGFGPVGPAVVERLDWRACTVGVTLDGRRRQHYPLSDMILPPAAIVSLISREMTLEPGDLIACGTSVGALPMRPGMEVAVSIEGIGTLTNRFDRG